MEFDQPSGSLVKRWVRGAIGLTLIALGLLLAVTIAQSWRASESALSQAVDTDMAGLVDIYAGGGLEELRLRLADRTVLATLDGRQPHYLLGKAGAQVIVGGQDSWPPLSPTTSQEGFVTLADGTPVYARATRLGPQLDLLVAREYAPDSAAVRQLAAIFLATAAIIVLAVWLLGWRAAGRLSARIATISAAFREAEHGKEPKLALSDPRDEIDVLGGHSARAIARCAALARTHRHMTDHIAHEIRTPLTHLENRLVSLQRSTSCATESETIERGRQDIRSVVAMLDSLLDIAASEARVGDRTGLEDVNVSKLAEGLVELYEGSAEEAGITMRSHIAPGVILRGERMQLTRLISNLLDNALKYVPRGGEVRLSVSEGPVIEVADNGPGIDAALRPFVFDRFRSGKPREGTTSHGLGLALARAIALRHELGIVLVEADAGATFVIKPHDLWLQGEDRK